MFHAIARARKEFSKPFFMEVVATACWNIWLQRNGWIFQNEKPSFSSWKARFIHDASLLGYRMKKKHHVAYMGWIRNLVYVVYKVSLVC